MKSSFFAYFADLPDPRVDRTRLHDLADILAIAVCATICGADGWTERSEGRLIAVDGKPLRRSFDRASGKVAVESEWIVGETTTRERRYYIALLLVMTACMSCPHSILKCALVLAILAMR